MAKGYWVVCYREITDPARLATYAQLAGPAVQAGGGRFLVRGPAAHACEAGRMERTVVIEFDSLEHALAAHNSSEYKAALTALGGAAVRDFRIVAGV